MKAYKGNTIQQYQILGLRKLSRETVKITFNASILPKLKILVKTWMQLEILEEDENTITFSGTTSLINCVLLELGYYVTRHGAKYLDDYVYEYQPNQATRINANLKG